MGYHIDVISDFSQLLKDLKLLFDNPKLIDSGRPSKKIDLKPREVIVLSLIYMVLKRTLDLEEIFVAGDHQGRDGLVVIRGPNDKLKPLVKSENILINKYREGELTSEIIKVIDQKIKKGKEYAIGRSLTIYIHKDGEIDKDRIITYVLKKSSFKACWIFAYQGKNNNKHHFHIIQHGENFFDSAVRILVINEDFEDWKLDFMPKI